MGVDLPFPLYVPFQIMESRKRARAEEAANRAYAQALEGVYGSGDESAAPMGANPLAAGQPQRAPSAPAGASAESTPQPRQAAPAPMGGLRGRLAQQFVSRGMADLIAADPARFEATIKALEGEQYSLSPGGQRFSEGGGRVANNPALLENVNDAMVDPRTGAVRSEIPSTLNLGGGSEAVRVEGGAARPIYRNEKTFAETAQGPKVYPVGQNQRLVRVDPATGQPEILIDATTDPGGVTGQPVQIGDLTVRRVGEIGNSAAGRIQTYVTRGQAAERANRQLGLLVEIIEKDPTLAGLTGSARSAGSTVVDVASAFMGLGGSPQDAEAMARDVEQGLSDATRDARADADVQAEAQRLYSNPATRGSIEALSFNAGYQIARANKGSQERISLQEIVAARRMVSPTGFKSPGVALEVIRAQQSEMQSVLQEIEQQLGFEPGIRVERGNAAQGQQGAEEWEPSDAEILAARDRLVAQGRLPSDPAAAEDAVWAELERQQPR